MALQFLFIYPIGLLKSDSAQQNQLHALSCLACLHPCIFPPNHYCFHAFFLPLIIAYEHDCVCLFIFLNVFNTIKQDPFLQNKTNNYDALSKNKQKRAAYIVIVTGVTVITAPFVYFDIGHNNYFYLFCLN